MSDLDELEEIEQRTTVRVNNPHHKRKLSALGVSLTMRGSPRPESSAGPRPSPALAVERQPAPPASIRTMPEFVATADEVIAVVRRHQDIADLFRFMEERLGLTNEFCDDAGGLTNGDTHKNLRPRDAKSGGPTT